MKTVVRKWDAMSFKEKAAILLLLVFAGILLSGLGSSKSNAPKEEAATRENDTGEYKSSLENQLKETLGKVEGIGEIDVMITLESEVSREIVYNESTSENSSSADNQRTTTQVNSAKDAVMVKNSDGTYPYTHSGSYPKITGAIIVAEGADSPVIKAYIIDAVKAVLNIAPHKIVVLPKSK